MGLPVVLLSGHAFDVHGGWQHVAFLYPYSNLVTTDPSPSNSLPSTLPQGTINMNQCSDVIDGEARTGQKNSLCILTPDKEHFIRAENKEIINGWQETLVVYPRTNKQNQKKKRKVEPPTPQESIHGIPQQALRNLNGHLEPGPAKVTVTSSSSGGSIPCLPSSIAAAERVPASRASLWQEDRRGRSSIPCSRSASCLSQLGQSYPAPASWARATRPPAPLRASTGPYTQSYPPPSSSTEDRSSVNGGRKARVESGYFSLEKAKPEPPPHPPQQLPLSSPSGPGGLHRYSSSDTEPLASPYCPSPERGGCGDPFSPPGPLFSNGSSTISSSQSSLDSETSSTTTPSWDGRGGGAADWAGGAGRAGARDYTSLADVPRARRLSHREAFRSEKKRQETRTRTRSPGREEVARLFGQERRRSQVIEKFETLEGDGVEHMETSSSSEPPSSSTTNAAQRQGRSERRHFPNKQDCSLDAAIERTMPDVSSSSLSSYRRAKSLDRRATESSMTPDLLNFKKGWMTKLYEEGLWKKHWFVLTDQSLRYYRDSVAEEAADLDGEIDLSTCHDVTEVPVQRNYGFQIHTKEGAFTLSAMTSGIRRNWIQAIMKNVRPTIAPDVTRKNVSLKLSVLKHSSLPDERVKARAALETSPQPPTETPALQGEPPNGDGSGSEQRRSRIRERRREGRCKTFDWADFRKGQPPETEAPDGRPEKAPDIGPASSTPSSPSSSPPGSSTTSSPSSSSGAPLREPPAEEELEQERARRREERRRRFQTCTSAPERTAASTEGEVRTPVEQGRMEVDAPQAGDGGRERGKPPDVQVEIEQRWHQVETTPLREERQVPITTIHPSDPAAERPPPQELAALLDKELEQTQKELAKLQEQNSLLQAQLQDARGRELSARERLHKLNQDLQNELEAQRRKQELTNQQVQALKRNYNEAKDVIRHHESEIQALQAKLNNAMAEILISEQAVAKMRSELKLEQERFRDRKEEWEQDEQALRTQLKDSEDRLKDVEAHLLEKSQALRDLERQQALQRDHLKEVQKLQERLSEVTGRLIATEEAQALKEERLQKNLHVLQESQEKERQSLVKRLVEAEGKGQEMEERLQEAEQQVEALLREKRTSGLVNNEVVHQIEQQLAIKADAIEKLSEALRQLEEEKSQLTCRCQELLNQISEADNEVAKLQNRLKAEESDYFNLEHSYEKVSEEFRRIGMILHEKEQEIHAAKEMYERLMERKEQDLNEAMIKMAALGSSLEETELKLQAKEELICKMGQGYMEPCSSERDLEAKLVVAEDRISELEQHLNELQLGYSDLQMEHSKLQEDCDVLQSISTAEGSSLTAVEGSNSIDEIRPQLSTSNDGGGSLVKRQRIRFSSIHCQKYVHLEGAEKLWASGTSSDINQDHSLSEESGSSDAPYQYITSASSDPEKFISIIHALETKLFTTEEKLKDITQKLEEQQGRQLQCLREQHGQWAESEAELRDQLNESLSTVNQLTAQLQQEMDKRGNFSQEMDCSIRANLKHFYEEKFQKLKADLLDAHRNLQHRELALKEIVKSSKKTDFDRVMQEVSTEFGFSQGKTLADISPPELAPYVEQVEMEVARDLAEEIVSRHLQGSEPSCGFESVESTHVGRERLITELRMQAEVLQRLSQEVEVACNAESGSLRNTLLNISQANPSYQNFGDISTSSVCMREAMIQAQIAYIACKLRVDHERDLKKCKEACQGMNFLCQEHAQNVGAIRERYEASMQDERQSFTQNMSGLQEENETLKREVSIRIAEISQQQERMVQLEERFQAEMEELKTRYEMELAQVEQRRSTTELALMEKTADSQHKLDMILMDIERMEDRHEEHVQKLEDRFQGKIRELQQIHEEEMQRLHEHYMQTIHSMQETLERIKARHPDDYSLSEEATSPTDQALPMEEEPAGGECGSMVVLRERIQELETQMNAMKDELENKHLGGDVSSLKEKYQKDFESLKATCERGFAAMEETHQKVIEDIQRQHQREVSKLLEERERLLAEETAATIAAIEAMKNAHREELEKTQRSQLSGMSSDIEELHRQYEEELQSIHRELEVLSEQYSQKCLENAHLAQALEAERQALRQCQRENQELNAHNQELNNRLTVEITRMRSCFSGEVAGSPLSQGKDLYELEVLLRVKESEIQYLKQEIHSLKDELQSALRDKKYATDKYKDIYTELSIVKAKADCDISKLKEQLMVATEALGERRSDGTTAVQGYDIMKSKSNPDFLKKERSSLSRQIRGIRSKSLKEGLTVQERMKLFEAKDSKKI
ncbi:hypothetical protein COCON_G00030520 [Conger conger]|uniref:PH domain-containing protein n=1 Tax=Conger conger TaxID=82655 RepID=A0A9Q1I5B5_CONCO|nr:hypothetical protein COCON_G00030520 [Conger conger]